ncbi:unnamed protein product [Merluccius merluccius]
MTAGSNPDPDPESRLNPDPEPSSPIPAQPPTPPCPLCPPVRLAPPVWLRLGTTSASGAPPSVPREWGDLRFPCSGVAFAVVAVVAVVSGSSGCGFQNQASERAAYRTDSRNQSLSVAMLLPLAVPVSRLTLTHHSWS